MEIKNGMERYQLQNFVDQLERRRDTIIDQKLEITVSDFVDEILVSILVMTDKEYVDQELQSAYKDMLDDMQAKGEDHE